MPWPTLIRYAFSLTAANCFPFLWLLPDKTTQFCLRSKRHPGYCCPLPSSCQGRARVYTPAAINQSQEEKLQGEWQKCKAQNWFSASTPPPNSSPSYLSWRKWNRGQVGERVTKGSHLLALSTPVPTFSVLFIFICHFGLSSQIESCFPNWPVKSFCHVEIISRAKSGNLRQPGSRTAGWNGVGNKRQCE